MQTIQAKALTDVVTDIFVAAGVTRAESERIAGSLVGANLTGHDSHGVVRVPRYVEWKEDGDFLPGQTVSVVTETPVSAVLDGHYGFGQTVAPQAVDIGIAKARAMGLSLIALKNAGHVGRVGEWAERAATAGLVSMHYVNAVSSLLVAPFGGVDRRFSTAPYSVGIPRPGDDPLILDFATSLVAEGKVMVASQGGKPVPANALIAPDGTMSGDPHVLYGPYEPSGPRNYKQGEGAIRAFGDHKGSGLAFMCELLGGALTGTGAAEEGRRWANGMLSIYIDPAKLAVEDFFPAEVRRYAAFVKSSRPATQGAEVLVPGEPEIRMRKKRLAEGIPLPDDTRASIAATARRLGLAEERIKAALRS